MGKWTDQIKSQNYDPHNLFKKPVQKTKQPLSKLAQKHQDLISNFQLFNSPPSLPPLTIQDQPMKAKNVPLTKQAQRLASNQPLLVSIPTAYNQDTGQPSPFFPSQLLQSLLQSLCQRQVMELSLSLWQVLGKQSSLFYFNVNGLFYLHICHGSNRRLIRAMGGALGQAQWSRQVGAINKGYSGHAEIDAHL